MSIFCLVYLFFAEAGSAVLLEAFVELNSTIAEQLDE